MLLLRCQHTNDWKTYTICYLFLFAAGPAQPTARLHLAREHILRPTREHLPPRPQPPLADTGTPFSKYAGYAEHTEDAEYAEYAEYAECAEYTPCRPRLHTSRHPPPLLGLRKDYGKRGGGGEEETVVPATVRERILQCHLREDRCGGGGGGGCAPRTPCTHAQPLKRRTHPPPPPPRAHLLGLRGGGQFDREEQGGGQVGGQGGWIPPCFVGLKRQVAGRDNPPQGVSLLVMLRGGGRIHHFMDAEEEAIEGPEMWKHVFLCGTELEQMNDVYAILWVCACVRVCVCVCVCVIIYI